MSWHGETTAAQALKLEAAKHPNNVHKSSNASNAHFLTRWLQLQTVLLYLAAIVGLANARRSKVSA